MKKTISFVLILFPVSTMAIPLGNYIMVDRKGDGFVRFCKAETTEELENINLTKENIYLSLPEKTNYMILKKIQKNNGSILEVENQFKVEYKYLISKTNDDGVYQWEAYSGKKKIDDLSFFAIKKSFIGKIKDSGECQ